MSGSSRRSICENTVDEVVVWPVRSIISTSIMAILQVLIVLLEVFHFIFALLPGSVEAGNT